MRKCILLMVLVAAALVAGTAMAAELHVPSGFSTIQAAINAAMGGDVIYVDPGTYVENVGFNGKDVILQSTQGPETTTIQGAPFGGATVSIGPDGAIDGFTITGGTGGMEVRGAGTIITGNIFQGNRNNLGAAIGGNVSSPLIEANIFRNNECDSQFISGTVVFINSSSPRISTIFSKIILAAP